eukprot:5739841-Alexandrium_andersonii.AAC.1
MAPACVCGRECQPGLAPAEQRVGAVRLSSGEWAVGVCWRSRSAFVGRPAGVCWRSRPSGSRPLAGPVGGG